MSLFPLLNKTNCGETEIESEVSGEVSCDGENTKGLALLEVIMRPVTVSVVVGQSICSVSVAG